MLTRMLVDKGERQ